MRQISEYIVKLFEKRGVICASAEEREVYIYGFDIAIYTFLSTLGLFFIGWMAGRPNETTLLIFVYYINQSFGGGFHASSHLMCFLTMVWVSCFSSFLSFFRIHFLPASGFPLYLFFLCGCIRLFFIQINATLKESPATH